MTCFYDTGVTHFAFAKEAHVVCFWFQSRKCISCIVNLDVSLPSFVSMALSAGRNYTEVLNFSDTQLVEYGLGRCGIFNEKAYN